MEKKDGGPAFPFETKPVPHGRGSMHYRNGGMSLRDYFAGQALQGFVARIGNHDANLIAHDAYILADAMLSERGK